MSITKRSCVLQLSQLAYPFFSHHSNKYGFLSLHRELMGTDDMWPYVLAVSGLPAILQFLSLLWFPEAPRYLYIDKGDEDGCKKGEATLNVYDN